MAVLSKRNSPVQHFLNTDFLQARAVNSEQYKAVARQIVLVVLLLDILNVKDTPCTTKKLFLRAHPLLESCLEKAFLTLEMNALESVNLWHLDIQETAGAKLSLQARGSLTLEWL